MRVDMRFDSRPALFDYETGCFIGLHHNKTGGKA